MSIHNAIHRRHPHGHNKRREHRHKGRKSMRWGKGRIKKWTRIKRRHNRRERRAAKSHLNPIARTFCYVKERFDLAVQSRHRRSLRDLRSDRVVAAARTRRKRFRECLVATWYRTIA